MRGTWGKFFTLLAAALLFAACASYHVRRANIHLIRAQLKGIILQIDTVGVFRVERIDTLRRGVYLEWQKTKKGKIGTN